MNYGKKNFVFIVVYDASVGCNLEIIRMLNEMKVIVCVESLIRATKPRITSRPRYQTDVLI